MPVCWVRAAEKSQKFGYKERFLGSKDHLMAVGMQAETAQHLFWVAESVWIGMRDMHGLCLGLEIRILGKNMGHFLQFKLSGRLRHLVCVSLRGD